MIRWYLKGSLCGDASRGVFYALSCMLSLHITDTCGAPLQNTFLLNSIYKAVRLSVRHGESLSDEQK